MRLWVMMLCATMGTWSQTSAAAPVFSKEIAPLLRDHCATCHSPGEVAPMAFTDYHSVRPWARAIREAVVSRTMPPWHADPAVGCRFENDRSLTAEQIRTIVAWVDAGAPEGVPGTTIAPQKVNRDWKLGSPDLVVRLPGYQVPARGEVQYTYFVVPTNFTKDVWMRAAEIRVDQRAVVHHINTYSLRIPSALPRNICAVTR